MANNTDHLLGLGHSNDAHAFFDLQQSLRSTRMELGLGDNHKTTKHHSKRYISHCYNIQRFIFIILVHISHVVTGLTVDTDHTEVVATHQTRLQLLYQKKNYL